MPRRTRRAYKPKRRVMRKRTYRRRPVRAAAFKSIVGTTRNTSVYNKFRAKPHFYKDTFTFSPLVGTGTQLTGLLQFDIGGIPRYNQLIAMYRSYKIHSIKIIMRLRTIELTDNAGHPHMLMRYNYDPNLAIGSVTETFMLRQNNVVSKQFIHNTPEGCTLEYTIKPCTMTAIRQWNTSGFTPSPRFNQWCDFAGGVTNEQAWFGLVYWLSNLPTEQIIDFNCQMSYSCRDII